MGEMAGNRPVASHLCMNILTEWHAVWKYIMDPGLTFWCTSSLVNIGTVSSCHVMA